jgi:Leucine-rich repeat (LRR) protein
MDAPAIRNWMIENPELLNAVTRLDLSSSNLGSNKILRGRISSVPKEIGLFVNLQCLLLSGNLLKRLCPEIQQLVNLRHLDLEDNPFSEFPPKFGQLVYHNGRGFYNDKRPISI